MKKSSSSVLQLSLIFLLIGCGSEEQALGVDPTPMTPPSESEIANVVFDSLALGSTKGSVIIVEGGVELQGSGPDAPRMASFPDFFEASSGKATQIEVGYESSTGVSALRISVEKAERSFEVALPNAETGFSAIALTLTLPDQIETDLFCLLASAVDSNGAISDAARGCIAVDESDAGTNRVIHFATFETDSLLGTLDIDSREVLEIGRTGQRLGDIAFLDNRLYGVGENELFELSLDTGAASTVMTLGTASVNALESREGLLYAASAGGDYLVIDPLRKEVLVRGHLGSGVVSSGDLVFLDDGTLVLTALTGKESDELMRIEPTTGVATSIGDIGFNLVFGVGVFRGQLLGITFDGEFILIDQDTGGGALIDQTDALRTGGASVKRLSSSAY